MSKLSPFNFLNQIRNPVCFLTGAVQEFLSEAYLWYVEDGNSRRTPLIGKRTIYELETLHVSSIFTPHIIQRLGNLAQGAHFDGLHQFFKDVLP